MIDVAIADRYRLIRESLRTLAGVLKGCQVLGFAPSVMAAIKLAKQQ